MATPYHRVTGDTPHTSTSTHPTAKPRHARDSGRGLRRLIAATERSELPSGLNANEKFDRIPDQHRSFTDPSEDCSARKQLVVNVNCHPHRTLQHQDRA